MFNAKSFDLVAEEKKQAERAQLYNPRRLRWLHYIALPALIGFAIMLILVNIDFSSDWNGVPEATALHDSRFLQENTKINSFPLPQPLGLSTRANIFCYENDDSRCNLTCDGDLKNNLRKQLETQQNYCNGLLGLRLMNCYFDGGSINRDLFKGSFRLFRLEIIDCDLDYIENEAFQHGSFRDLNILSFMHTKFITLERNTFNGLYNLRKLMLLNLHSNRNIFKGNNFLQPLAQTLVNVTMLQLSNYNTSYEPDQWFADNTFKMLKYLNLESNNFADVLDQNTFKNMPDLRYLNLANCSIRTLDASIFERNWDSLQELDLSKNALVTLNGDFVTYANVYKVELKLSDNKWHCGCENEILIEYIKRENCNETPKCNTPLKLQNYSMNAINLNCKERTTPTKPEEVSNLPNTETGTNCDFECTQTTQNQAMPTPPIKSTTDPKPKTSTEVTFPSKEDGCESTAEDDYPTFQHTFTCTDPADVDNTHKLPFDYDASINITDFSITNVLITIFSPFHENWLLFYIDKKIAEIANYGVQIENHTHVFIDDLICHHIYIFCLVIGDNSRRTSPLNCRAHRLPLCQISWFHKYQVLILSFCTVGILLFLAVGAFLMYGVLRKRPDWLYGSKRLMRTYRNSYKMLLLPKNEHNESASVLTYDNMNLHPNLCNTPIIPENSYDDISFYHEIQKTKIYKTSQMSPNEEAPSTPSNNTNNCSRNSSTVIIHSATDETNLTYEELI